MLTGAREKKYCAQVENSWKHFVREREKISRHLFSQNPCMVRVVSFLVLSYVILHLPSERYKREIGALQRINFHLKNPHWDRGREKRALYPGNRYERCGGDDVSAREITLAERNSTQK
jgi:hypothetical protein